MGNAVEVKTGHFFFFCPSDLLKINRVMNSCVEKNDNLLCW